MPLEIKNPESTSKLEFLSKFSKFTGYSQQMKVPCFSTYSQYTENEFF